MSSVILNATAEKYFDISFVEASSLCRAVAFFADILFVFVSVQYLYSYLICISFAMPFYLLACRILCKYKILSQLLIKVSAFSGQMKLFDFSNLTFNLAHPKLILI